VAEDMTDAKTNADSQLKQLTLAIFKILSERSCKYTSSKIADFNYMMKHKECTSQNETILK